MKLCGQGKSPRLRFFLPAKQVRPYTFTTPIAARVLAAGGHLHEYGTALRLEDESGNLVQLPARTDDNGHLAAVARDIFWTPFTTPKLRPNVRYTLTAEYENPTGRRIPGGAMGQMYLAFLPDDYAAWPQIDRSDAGYQKDLTSVRHGGASSQLHSH